jgi:hypothetical protein
MAKHGFTRDALSPKVRPANVEDVPGIVKRSAEHWRTLAKINPRFWHIHPEADSRFDAWMRRSLTFKDRDMLVVAEAGEVHGYVIAQPIAPLLIPAVTSQPLALSTISATRTLRTSQPRPRARRAAPICWQPQKLRSLDAAQKPPWSSARRRGHRKSRFSSRVAIAQPRSGC